ncbi:signal peptide peptidase SppA [Chryseobacterium lacus]|uniref:Signal peptide peptidase SppA n=1 Tax=Chryseobacterium lacus TaxID=2058346 RepID=A0A368N2V8_9FLAO|nr:signal peptide peptidase SppA [Chryseobacterium lacus]RCU43861.1 signal peptide peptidase SppA [Chryseobacterium lacus]RST28784.1 signal peptide peptidase SppA [Chryseobacterium lacus]
MKSFFKSVLANIVAIFIIGVIFFVFFVFMIAMSAAMGDPKVNVKSDSILTLDYKTNIIDSPTEDQQGIFDFNNKNQNILVYDFVEAIQNAKNDDKIKGISIETDFISAGFTQLDAVRAALEDFKKSGKFVYAYGNMVSQPAYYLGSVADQYYLHPSGGIELKGMATEVIYWKSFAEKYGIGLEVIRHGKYKAAVEPYLRDDMSEENREQLSTLLNDIWSTVSTKIAASRKIEPAVFKTAVDSLYGIIPELSVQHKLADKLIQKSEYDQLLKQKLKVKKEKDLNRISVSKYIAANSDRKSSGKDGQVAVLYASGQIFNGEGYQNIYAKNFVEEIQKIADNDKIKAVVFRINSPGGSANASDEILFELQELKKKKPLVVSFGDYAASGGYYMAMAADKIYSEPNTITGSIGVFGMITYFKDLANRNGINSYDVTTNSNSNYYSIINGVSPSAVDMFTKSVEGTYKRFVYFVTQNRKKSFEQIDEVGGGRVWSGTRAKQIGLVDELGSLHDAVNFAAQKAKLKEYKVSAYPKKLTQFEQIFKDFEEDKISARYLRKKMGDEQYKIFEQVTNPKLQSGVIMGMPYTITLK